MLKRKLRNNYHHIKKSHAVLRGFFVAFKCKMCYYISVKGSDSVKREEMYKSLFEQFGKSAHQFCEDSEGIFCEASKEYKGSEKADNLKGFFAKIYYNSFYVKFTYTAHSTMGLVNSVLGCSVCLDKNGNSREIPLPLVTDYLDYNISSPMFIPNITDEKGMKSAFIIIGDVLLAILPELSGAAADENKNRILNTYTEEMKYIFDVDDLDNLMDYYFYDFFVLRFTTDVFDFYMKGDYEKTCKKLGKIKKPTGYEKRLLDSLQSGMYEKCQTALQDISKICNSATTPKDDMKELFVMIISWFILTPLTSAVYLLIFFLVFLMENKDSVYLMGAEYNYPFCICLGFFTAIAVSYFTRFKFYKLFNKKDYEKYLKVSSMQNGKGADRFMKGFTYIIFCVSIVMSVLLCKWNINFTENGFTDNTKFLSLRGEYYTYEQIEKVYYLPQRTNDFGDVLNFPSYVMVVDGKEIDFYEFADIVDYEGELLTFLQEKGVKIEKAD